VSGPAWAASDGDPWAPADRARVLTEILTWLPLYLGSGGVTTPGAAQAACRLLGLPIADLRRLRAVHFLLSTEVAAAVEDATPQALRGPARGALAPTRGRALRGQADWGRTARERATAGGDAGLFAYGSVVHADRWRLVELRALLRTVVDLAQQASPGAGGSLTSGGELPWTVRCAALADLARQALAHPRLAVTGASTAPQKPDRRAPPPWWPAVEAARSLQRRLIGEEDVAALTDLLAQRVLAPANPDLLFEVWATLSTLATLEGLGWRRLGLRLLAPGVPSPLALYAQPFTSGNAGEARLSVYAQHTPLPWRQASRYAATFSHYGVAGAMRRPDMVLEVERQGRRRWLLVEVKRTADPTYTADSIYKVLGYLADFATPLAASPGVQAVLLLWRLPQAPREGHPPGPLALATPETFDAVLGTTLHALADC